MGVLGFGMDLDQDAGAGVLLLRVIEHFAEGVGVGVAVGDAGVALGLVDDEDVAGLGHGVVGVEAGILGEMRLVDAGDGAAGTIHQHGVVERVGGQQGFEVGGGVGVEMDTLAVDGEAERWFAAAAGEKGAEEDVLDPDEAGAGGFGDFLAAGGVGGVAPDGDQIVGPRLAEAEGVACQFHDPADAGLAEEPGVEIENPPVTCVAGGFAVVLVWCHDPPSVSTAVATEPIEPSEPVRAEITLLHWAKGASVT